MRRTIPSLLFFLSLSSALSCDANIGDAGEDSQEEPLSQSAVAHPVRSIDSSFFVGNVYIDGGVLTGMVCSDGSVELRAQKSGYTRTIRPALVVRGADFREQYKYMYSWYQFEISEINDRILLKV